MPDNDLGSIQRLADIEESGLLDATAVAALDALTQVAHTALGTTALVNVVTDDRQVTVSLATERRTDLLPRSVPLSHSLCQYVVTSGAPYLVVDAADDRRYELAVREYGVGAYAGFPLRGTRGTVIGAVCSVGPAPRDWSAHDLSILGSLAAAAESVVAMHSAARRARLARVEGPVPTDPAARVQHVLRTPLTSLVGFLELLLDGELGELSRGQLDALQRCHTNAERLREAVGTLAAGDATTAGLAGRQAS